MILSAAAAYYVMTALRPPVPAARPVYALAARVLATGAVIAVLSGLGAGWITASGVLTLWVALLYALVAQFPWMSGVRAGHSTELRRGDTGLSLALALVAALGMQGYLFVWLHLTPQSFDAVNAAWLVVAVLAQLGVLAWTLWRLRPRLAPGDRLWADALMRLGVAAAGALTLYGDPWYTLGWLGLWAGLEVLIDSDRKDVWHRAQAVAALGVTGWMLGHVFDGAVFGLRAAMLLVAAGAVGVVLLLAHITETAAQRSSRSRTQQSGAAEPAVYGLIAGVLLVAVTDLLGFTGVLRLTYGVGVLVVLYGVALLLAGQLRLLSPGDRQHAGVARSGSEDSAAWRRQSWLQLTVFFLGLMVVLSTGDWGGLPWFSSIVSSGAHLAALGALLLSAVWMLLEGFAGKHLEALGHRLRERLPLHAAAHLGWAALINLLVSLTGQPDLWWLTALAWAAAVAAVLPSPAQQGPVPSSASGRADMPQGARRTRGSLAPARVYGAAASGVVVVAIINAHAAWWTDLLVAAAALALAAVSGRRLWTLPEAPVVLPLGLAAATLLTAQGRARPGVDAHRGTDHGSHHRCRAEALQQRNRTVGPCQYPAGDAVVGGRDPSRPRGGHHPEHAPDPARFTAAPDDHRFASAGPACGQLLGGCADGASGRAAAVAGLHHA
ncbi:hypothetical protein [Nesterenkonia flava]|uniref:Uncharacterized protein n=1 Tax=Nesterenkonia flava TaxID=469799 RepID=A0ABU1FWD0_9MICC|nr:hypothetical protein [Nesterenkonia flava]MDR5712443.1 hypothetical protein [Nesterenkonia flava]